MTILKYLHVIAGCSILSASAGCTAPRNYLYTSRSQTAHVESMPASVNSGSSPGEPSCADTDCSTRSSSSQASFNSQSSPRLLIAQPNVTTASYVPEKQKNTRDLQHEFGDADKSTSQPALKPIVVATDAYTGFTGAVEPQSSMSLADFESLALANNPTIRELAATTQKAAGFRTQVGLRANPLVGYQGQQLADRGTDQHLAFVEQEIVTAGKLELNRRVLNEALRAQLMELEAQKLRVTTDIRVKFYEALAAQRQIELIDGFRAVTDKGYEIAELRLEAAEGSKIDVLQAKVQKNEIELALKQANVRLAAAWRELAALAGAGELLPVRIQGELPRQVVSQNWNALAAAIVGSSPEYSAAQRRVAQARAALERQGVQAIPNLIVNFGAGVDNGTNSGMMNVQVGAPLPLYNRNQGDIAAAKAEFCRALMEAKRIENSIQARLAATSGEYDSATAAVSQYADEILPSAKESLELAEVAYEAGETSFIQVLVARRTYFDTNLQFVTAQSRLAAARARVDGYLLSGGLDAVIDRSGDDALRGHTFSQQ